jgi:hypothetical protein
MTNSLRLANRTQTTAVDLLNGNLKLVAGSWHSRTAPPMGTYTHVPYGAQPAFAYYEPVVETLDLAGCGTAVALIAAINDLEDLLTAARRWHAGDLEPESSWLETNADGESVSWFGHALPVLVSPSRRLAHTLEDVHEAIANAGYFLIGLHAAAALFHHYVVRDNTLRLMLPWASAARQG